MNKIQNESDYSDAWKTQYGEFISWLDKESQNHSGGTLRNWDKLNHAMIARSTQGVSPFSIYAAFGDWYWHLMASPGKKILLMNKSIETSFRFLLALIQACIDPESRCTFTPIPKDHRFQSREWQEHPFRLIYQGFLLIEDLLQSATTDVHGVSKHHEDIVNFVSRQLLDIVSPSNFMPLNPKVLNITQKEGGMNLVKGIVNYLQDTQRSSAGQHGVGTEAYIPGHTVAVTPGEVIYRNELMELIQYHPTTPQVHKNPILIVPAWIMKYYILDLSPKNSLVKYLVDQGHTVFMISWKDPNSQDRHFGMDDYLQLGVLDALDIIQNIIPNQKVNTVGYCLGGTLLAIAAAYLAREGKKPIQSMTLLAAQIDFTEAGELSLFIDESQVSLLEDLMWLNGYLDSKQMAGTFQMLRSNDLIWSRLINEYLSGERMPLSDLMAWSMDSTRMPYRMHSEYLRKLFMNNDLFEGRFSVKGKPIALSDINLPTFSVGTETDHIAPWRSVYKIKLLKDSNVTFVLTSGGHNAGIVNEPGHAGRRFRKDRRQASDRYMDPKEWYESVPVHEGSWWPSWVEWIEHRNQGQGKVAPPSIGNEQYGYSPIQAAPGSYILGRSMESATQKPSKRTPKTPKKSQKLLKKEKPTCLNLIH